MVMTRLGLAVAAVIILLDQATKLLILHVVMDPPRVIEVTPFFNLVLVWNRGVSFGLFSAESPWTPWVLTAVALAITVVLLVWLRRVDTRLMGVALGLVIGGAIGNVIDRVFQERQAVIDFLDFYIGSYHWPAFNVADSAITVGVAFLLIDSLIVSRRQHRFAAENQNQNQD